MPPVTVSRGAYLHGPRKLYRVVDSAGESVLLEDCMTLDLEWQQVAALKRQKLKVLRRKKR